MNRWVGDLLLGVRLAVGGGRNSWVRLALTGVGIGLGVAVLLVATSFPSVLTARDARADAVRVDHERGQQPIAGVDPLYRAESFNEYRDHIIRGSYLLAGGPAAPVPPGAERIPGDGEILLSPELARLLASPEGELLRPRFPQRVVGTIGQAGLEGPYELRFYAGEATVEQTAENTVYAFGATRFGRLINPTAYTIGMVFVIVLLFPVFVFVGISTRLSGAQRDRRLAALRLIGASAHRVRRIASGEALVGAVAGVVVGVALFFFLRQFTESFRFGPAAVFRSDLTPTLPLAALVVLLVPALAVATAMFALRRTIIEPLGVVRDVKPVRRTLWWRLVPIVGGIGLLVSQVGLIGEGDSRPSEFALSAGIGLLMLGIPILLPWLVERSVGHVRGGSPAWQLAIRRLQLDSGTTARVVGGVAVALAGAIALQTVLATAERITHEKDKSNADTHQLIVTTTGNEEPAGLAGAKGVKEVQRLRNLPAHTGERLNVTVVVGECPALRLVLRISTCQEGASYLPSNSQLQAGERITFIDFSKPRSVMEHRGEWTVPLAQQVDGLGSFVHDVYVTPSVLKGVDVPQRGTDFHAVLDPAVPDAAEHARNAVGPMLWRANTYFAGQPSSAEADEVLGQARQALLAGSLIVLVLVGASLLVMALEQIRERRRPLAVLVASGVPRRVLAWSVLWQNAIPLLLALVVAVATGAGLGALLLKVLSEPVLLDWGGIALLTGATAAAVLVVTLLTLPSLRRATGALGLRSE